MLASPRNASFLRERAEKEGLKSLQTSIALFNSQQPALSWEIYVDGNRVTHLPYTARAGAKISIHDGASYFGVVTLPGTDLGGGNMVVLREGAAQEWNKIIFKPALVIDSYNFKSNDPLINLDWDRISKAFGGFALELADSYDYASFEAFQAHLAKTEARAHFEAPFNVSVFYKSGEDIFETDGIKTNDELVLVRPRVNGRPAFLPTGVVRDTSTSVQGDAIAIDKLGAVLRSEQGHMKFLQVEPKSGTFVAWNPLPDPAKFSLQVPGGMKVQSDGRLSLARVLVNPRENRVAITHAWREGQKEDPDGASALVLTGCETAPTVEFNGSIQTNLITRTIGGQHAFLVPLRKSVRSDIEIEKALGD
jgi:hypothetical protein